jgi:hypothetical protein
MYLITQLISEQKMIQLYTYRVTLFNVLNLVFSLLVLIVSSNYCLSFPAVTVPCVWAVS